MIKTIVIIFKICLYSSSRKIQLQQMNIDDYVMVGHFTNAARDEPGLGMLL